MKRVYVVFFILIRAKFNIFRDTCKFEHRLAAYRCKSNAETKMPNNKKVYQEDKNELFITDILTFPWAKSKKYWFPTQKTKDYSKITHAKQIR